MKTGQDSSLYLLERLEPRIMLSTEGAGVLGAGSLLFAQETVLLDQEMPDAPDDLCYNPTVAADGVAVGMAGDLPAPMSDTSFDQFPGAAGGISSGLNALGDWAAMLGRQSIPGADQILINAPNPDLPDFARSINFFHAPILPGGLYQLSIGGSYYQVIMDGAFTSQSQIAAAFADQINDVGEFSAEASVSMLNLLPGNPDLGTNGAGDLDILLSSWRDWGIFNQALPMIDLNSYWSGLEEIIPIPEFAYGSIAEMMDFGNVLSTYLTTPLASFLDANPTATLSEFLDEIRSLGAEMEALDFIIDIDGVFGEHLLNPAEGIEELLFTIPLQYIRGPPAYDLDLGPYAQMLGFSLSDLENAIQLPFDVIVELDLIFGYDLRDGILDPFFVLFSEEGIRARVEGLLDRIDTSLLVGILDTIVEAGTLDFDFEIAFNWHESVLEQGRIYYDQLLGVIGELENVLSIEVLQARFDALLPLLTDFAGVLLPDQFPQIRISVEDFLNRLPEIELIDFGRLEDFLTLSPEALLNKLLELGDTLRLLVDIDAYADLILPFSKDLDFAQLMDLPELYINQFMELFRVDGSWVFGDLQWFIDQMEDYVIELELVERFDFAYEPGDQRLDFMFEFETGLDLGQVLFGFNHSAGPIAITMSNSFFEISGRAGMRVGLSIDLIAPVVSVEAEAGFILPETGILPRTALIEILLENGALTDGAVVEISVESDPGNVSLEDLLLDINTALAASILGGLIQARLENGQFVFENNYAGASPSFLVKAPELIGHEHFEAAVEPPGARITLHALEAYANARIQAEGLVAAARLGFLDIVSGGGEMNFCFDIGVDFAPGGPVTLFDLRGTALNDAGSIDPAYTFRVNEGEHGCNGLILRGITISGNFDVQPPEAAYILINFAENFDFPGDLLDPAMYVVELIGDFGDLIVYPELTFDLLIQVLLELAGELETLLDVPVFTRKIPYLDVSLREILSFSDILGELALRAQEVGANSIQGFVDLVNDLLHELVAPVLSYAGVSLVVNVDGGVVDGIFRWDIFFEGAVEQGYAFNASPGGAIGSLVDLKADSAMAFHVLARADLRLGVDVSNPGAPEFLIFDESEILMEFLLDAAAEFMAAIGPVGLFVGPGHIRIDNGETGEQRDAAHAHWTLNPASGGSVGLAQLAGALDLDIQGILDSLLPLHFPAEHHLGDLGLSFSFTNFNQGSFEIEYTVPELDFSTMDFFGSLGEGIDLFFLALEQLVAGRFSLANLPFIGEQLRDLAVFLLDIREAITAAFNAVTNADATHIADLLTTHLGSLIKSGSVVLVRLEEGGSDVEWIEVEMVLGGQEVFDSGAFAFDLGLPLLGFDLDAGLDVVLDWEWALNFGVSRSDGFYLIVEQDVSELELELVVTIAEGSALTGTLGILFFSAEVNNNKPDTGLALRLDVDFTPVSGNRLGIGSLMSMQGMEVSFTGDANLHLVFELGFASGSGGQVDSLPSFVIDFDVEWSFINASLDAGVLGEAPDVRFSNMYLDLGSFIDNFLGPIVEQVKTYLDPIRDLIEFLDQNISALSWGPLRRVFDYNGDGKVTLMDLAQLFGTVGPGTAQFIDAAAEIFRLFDTLFPGGSTSGDMVVMSGGRTLIPINLGAGGFSLLGAGVDVRSTNVLDTSLAWNELIPDNDMENLFDDFGEGGLYRATQAARFELLILDPANVLKLLLGHDIEFFRFSPPSIELEFRFTKGIPIWPTPKVELVLTAAVGAKAQVTFGYDSSGIRRYIESGNAGDVFGGFYVVAGRRDPLLVLWGEIGGGASVSAGIGASAVAVVRLEARFSLFDPGGGKIYFSQISVLVRNHDLATVVDCLLEIEMLVTAEVRIRIFLDLLFTDVTLYRTTIGPFNLFGPITKEGGACLRSSITDRFEITLPGEENNDTMENAAYLGFAPGIHLRGASISHAMDNDWYAFELPQQDDVQIELRGAPSYVLRLYDADGMLLNAVNEGGSGVKRIRTGRVDEGVYYIQIFDASGLAIDLYELDIIPGRSSTTTVYYISGAQSEDPTRHSFYTLAVGNDGQSNAGTAPDRPAATVQHVLDHYALQPGDLLLIDAGHYHQNLVLGPQHAGIFLLGAPREWYEGDHLGEGITFGSMLTPAVAEDAVVRLVDTSEVTLINLIFDDGSVAIELDGASDTWIERVATQLFTTGIKGVDSASTTIVDVHLAGRNGIELLDSDDTTVRNARAYGMLQRVDEGEELYYMYAGTAFHFSGDRLTLEQLSARTFEAGLFVSDFDVMTLSDWSSRAVMNPIGLSRGESAVLADLDVTILHENMFEMLNFDNFSPWGLYASNIDSLTVNTFYMIGHPLTEDYFPDIASSMMNLWNVDHFEGIHFEAFLVEGGIQGEGLGDFHLSLSVVPGPSSLIASGEVALEDCYFGEGRIGVSGIDIRGTADITMERVTLLGETMVVDTTGALSLTDALLWGGNTTQWQYDAESSSWESVTEQSALTLAITSGPATISDIETDATTATLMVSGEASLQNNTWGGLNVTASSIAMQGNTVTAPTFFHAGQHAELDGNQLVALIGEAETLTMTGNTMTGAVNLIATAGLLTYTDNSNSAGLSLTATHGAIHFRDNHASSAVTLSATGGAALIERNVVMGMMNVTTDRHALLHDNEFLHITVTVGEAITFTANRVQGNVILTAGEEHLVSIEHNQIQGSLTVTESGTLVLDANEVELGPSYLVTRGDATLHLGNVFRNGSLSITAGGDVLLDDFDYDGFGVTVEAGGTVTVTGSSIRRNPPVPPGNLYQAGLTITSDGGSVLIENSTLDGIRTQVTGADDVTVQDNTFYDGLLAILDSISLLVEENRVDGLVISATLAAGAIVRNNDETARRMTLQAGAASTVLENSFTSGTHPSAMQITMAPGADLLVQQNTVNDGAVDITANATVDVLLNVIEGLGLRVVNAGTTTVNNNSIAGDPSAGYAVRIEAQGTGSLEMKYNSVAGNVVCVLQADGVLVEDNAFEQSGLLIERSQHVDVLDNDFLDGEIAILLDRVSAAQVRGNTVESAHHGLRLRGESGAVSSGVLIEDNSFALGGGIGVDIMNTHVNGVVVQDNIVYGYGEYGIHAVGHADLLRNTVQGNTVGVRFQSPTPGLWDNEIRDNQIGVTGSGFLGNDNRSADRHNLIQGNVTGVLANAGATVAFNRIYSNTTGVEAASGVLVRHNLIYRNTGASILVSGGDGAAVYNNTIYSPGGTYGVRVQGGATNTQVRNNIIWSESGVVLSVAYASDVGFQSDYNNLYASGTAMLGEWIKPFDDLLDWRLEVRQDRNSIGTTRIDPMRDRPLFMDLEGDDFRISSSTATTVNSGDPTFSFAHEPGPDGGPNGLRINQGAYGDTALAALSPASYVRMLTPLFHLDWEADTVRRIVWEAFNVAGNVTLEVHEANDGKVGNMATVGVFNQPAEVTEQPASWGSYFWSPNMNDIEGDLGKSYFIRIVTGALQSESRETFTVPEATENYYLSPDGDNRHSGHTPETAKATIYSYLENYNLIGKTIHVAAGTYIHVRDVIISSAAALGGNEAFTIQGPEAGLAVFDRADPRPGTTGMILDDASFMIIRRLSLVNGQVGLDVRNNSTHADISHLHLADHSGTQVWIRSGSTRATLAALTVEGGGSHGIVVDGRLDALTDSVVRNHGGTGVRLTDTQNTVLTGNWIENNAGGGIWISNSVSATTTVLGNADLSLGLGNVFVNNGGTQVQVQLASGTQVVGNTIYRTADHGAYHTGRGVLSTGSPVAYNVIFGHATGIEMTGTSTITGNRIYDHSQYGIRLNGRNNTSVVENVIYSSPYGIYNTSSGSFSGQVYRNNLIYGISDTALYENRATGSVVENNTFHVDGTYAIRLENAINTTLRNNIISVGGSAVGIRTDVTTQLTLASNYNLFDLRGSQAAAGFWNGLVRSSFRDWRSASFLDAASLATDPLFVDPVGADGVIGFHTFANDGRDDHFQLQSIAGSYHNSALAPVRDVATHQPVWLVPVLTMDSAHSPGIDRGDAATSFANEPDFNGGFVNLGAFGNTPLASHSPAEFVMLLNPQGGENRPRGQTFDIVWRSHDAFGTVDIRLWREGAGEPEAVVASGVANNGTYSWTVDGGLAIGDDYRMEILRADAVSGMSLDLFSVQAAINAYYVNDGSTEGDVYTTAVGDSGNTGLDPSSPRESIRAIIETYDLSPGDIIYVDAGHYILSANIILSLAESGIIIRGVEGATILDRNNRASGNYVFHFQGAADVTLENLTIQNAYRGIYAASGQLSGLTIRDSRFIHNGNAGIYLEANNPGLVVEDSYFEGANVSNESLGQQTYGIYLAGPSAVIRDSIFFRNKNNALQLNLSGTIDEILIEGNTISGSTQSSVSISGANSGSLRFVGNTVTGGHTALSLSGSQAVAIGNSVSGASTTGIQAASGARVEDNTVSGITSGVGIRAISSSIAIGNHVSGNRDGIGVEGAFAEGNTVTGNSRYGIYFNSGTLLGNTVMGNQTGLYGLNTTSVHQVLILNNVVYSNSHYALLLDGAGARARIYNNTLIQTVPETITVWISKLGAVADLRGNIIVSDDGVALRSVVILGEDYNLYDLRNGAIPFELGPETFTTLADWFFTTLQGARSMFADPLFVDEEAGDFRVQPGSPTINAADPNLAWVGEIGQHGGRANIGADGNTAVALPGEALTVAVFTPHDWTKWTVGMETWIEFLASGYGAGQSAAWFNAGSSSVAHWLQAPLVGSVTTSTISATNTLDLSHVNNPAPESVYRQYHSITNRADYTLSLPEGQYRLRLHFINALTHQSSFGLDVVIDGQTVLPGLVIEKPSDGNYRAVVVEIDVNVMDEGLDGLLSLVRNSGTVPFAGYELVRLYDDAPAGSFTVEISTDEGGTFQTIATGVELDLRGIGRVAWTPDAATTGRQAIVRVTSEGPDATSGASALFQITPAGNVYYINDDSTVGDVYTTAAGNNEHTGKSPDQPMASLRALLAAYSPGDGDIIYIDTGSYLLQQNLVLTAAQSGLTIIGAFDAGDPASVSMLNRNNRASGTAVFEMQGAANVTIEHLTLQNAHRAILAGSAGAPNLTVRNSSFLLNGSAGIWLDGNNPGLLVEGCYFEGSGVYQTEQGAQSYGVYTISTTAVIQDNVFVNNNSTAVHINPAGAGIFFEVRDNTVSGSGTGIYVTGLSPSGVARIDDNVVTGRANSTGILISGAGARATGNTVTATTTGINAQERAQVFDSVAVHGNITGINLGRDAVAIGNRVYNNTDGIVGADHQGPMRIEGNEVFDNSRYGISMRLGTVMGNVLYGNATGIYVPQMNGSHLVQISYNLIYDSTEQALWVSASNARVLVFNNTFVQTGAGRATLRADAALQMHVRNNILVNEDGVALQVSTAAAGSFAEDYNLYDLRGDAVPFQWGGVVYGDRIEWFFNTGNGSRSLLTGAQFVDEAESDYRLQAGSPAIDAGDPVFGWLFEPGAHGGRVNMGAFGNTASAAEGALPAIWVISPYDLTKWMQDGEATIEFLASGFGTGQSAAWYNAGEGTIGSWIALPRSADVSNGTISVSHAIDRSQVADPAPEAVYRQYHSFHTRADYQLVLPSGEYRLRLHLISVPTWRTEFRFDVELGGETVLQDVVVVDDPANPYRVDVVEIDVTVGEDGRDDLLSLVARFGTVYFAGLEVVRLYEDAPAGSFTVEVSVDEGATFQTVATGVGLDLRGMGRVAWTPDVSTIGREAVIRVTAETVANLSAVSPSFLIANSGNVYYVNNDSTIGNVYTTAPGNNMNSGKHPASPLGSLEAVLNTYSVGEGDIIYIDTGVYTLSGNLLLRAQHSGLTIVGAYNPDDPTARTVFDRGLRTSGAYAFDLYEVTNITLRHLEVTGAHTGIYIWIPSIAALGSDHIVLDHVRVFENTEFGMWIGRDNKRIEVHNSRFEGTGGASDPLRQHVGLYTISDTLIVENSVFSGNYDKGIHMTTYWFNSVDYHVSGTLVEGSRTGIHAGGGSGLIENSILRNNSSHGLHGGGTFELRDSLIEGNGFGVSEGTGVYSDSAYSQIVGNVILGNRIGVRVERHSAIITGNVIGLNEMGIRWAEGTGEISGNRIYGHSGHGIYLRWNMNIPIRNNQIYSNQIGIEKIDNGYAYTGTIENNVLYDHSVVAIRIAGGGGTFRIFNNTIFEASGAGIVLIKTQAARVSNNIVWVDAGFGITIDAASAGKVISDYNLFFNTGAPAARVGEWGGASLTTLADWQAGSGLDGNSLFADPLFFDRNGADDVLGYREVDGFMVDGGVDDNFHLLRNSPAIDRGVTLWSPRADHEGDTRADDPGTVNTGGERYIFEVLEESLFDASRGVAQGWTYSSSLRSLPLGFDFPYYDGLHDQVHLSISGLMGFVSSTTTQTRTGAALIGMYRFTPLWAGVNISAAGLDIFVCDAVEGELYIRWEARRDSPNTSVPVRFAVLFKDDGTMRFDYGEGNTGMTPVVGISYGNGVDYLFVDGHHESGDLNLAPSVLIRTAPGIVDIGAYEFKGDSTDETPPLITATLPSAVGEGGTARSFVGEIRLSFSEAIDTIDARSPHSFELLRDADGNSVFDSADEVFQLTPVYDPATNSIRLLIEDGVLPEGFYRLRIRASNLRDVSGNELDGNESGAAGGDYIRTFTVEYPPVTLVEAVVNDGEAQRSMVTSVTVTFDSDLDGRATAERLRIYSHETGEAVAAQVTWDAATFSARITFPTLTGGSLPNGHYTLLVDAADFEQADLRSVDANGDGEPGGRFELEFHRLFADTSGNKLVSNLDILRFRQTRDLDSTDPAFDARFDIDGDGQVGDAEVAALLAAVDEPLNPSQALPVIVKLPPEETTASLGESLEFLVHVLSPAPVTIVWFRGETEIARGLGLTQLVLDELTGEDFGSYRILALTDWHVEESAWFTLVEDMG